jgi:hypothetical protein
VLIYHDRLAVCISGSIYIQVFVVCYKTTRDKTTVGKGTTRQTMVVSDVFLCLYYNHFYNCEHKVEVTVLWKTYIIGPLIILLFLHHNQYVLSRVGVSVANNNGFELDDWIYQRLLCAISLNYNQL